MIKHNHLERFCKKGTKNFIYRFVALISILILSSQFFSLSSEAAEIKPDLRWCHMATGGRNGPYCVLSMNTTYLTGNWSTYFTDAKNEWINNSASKIVVNMVSYSTANLLLYTYNGTWPYIDCFGFTTLFDKSGNCFNDGMTSTSVPLSSFGDRINLAGIIFNPNYANGGGGTNAASNLKKTIVHEIGHCVNLAHLYYPTRSVMRQGWNFEYSYYFRPQAQERTDLLNYYNILYD